MMMKKALMTTALLCAAAGAAVFAQEDGAEVRLLDVGNYSAQFINPATNALSSDYAMASTDADWEKISALSGDPTDVDTPLEIAMLFTCAGVVDVRPVEAVNMLGTAREADLKLGAAAYMDMQAARFLGSDPAPYAAALKFITDRGRVTEADIKSFVKQGIAAVVDAEFNGVSFFLNTQYNAVLTRNASNQYILSYEGYFNGTKLTKTLPPANSLDALSREMLNGANKNDFNQVCVNEVYAQAALIPAVIFDGWKKATPGMVSPYELLTKALADFYTTPNRANYEVILGIQARTTLAVIADRDSDAFADALDTSIGKTIKALNSGLYERVAKDLLPNGAIMAAVEKPRDPRFGIFTLTKKTGDEIFVNKKAPATGLLVR